MRLEFKVLVVDDNPDGLENAIMIFKDHLADNGFDLKVQNADDLTKTGLKRLARKSGKEYDLVLIDFNLGGEGRSGADAVEEMRRELHYTDIIFYSSDSNINLWDELLRKKVMGVYIAERDEIDQFLKGIGDTIIGKAIDLSHMRGIAMAEVAELDVLMEETLCRIFACGDPKFCEVATDTLTKLMSSHTARQDRLKPLVEAGDILAVVGDSLSFSSADKYKAIRRAAKVLDAQPIDALRVLNSYEADIIASRNILAHAKEEIDEDGNASLRSAKRGAAPVLIDDTWMLEFRGKLRAHRIALASVCEALALKSAAAGGVQ